MESTITPGTNIPTIARTAGALRSRAAGALATIRRTSPVGQRKSGVTRGTHIRPVVVAHVVNITILAAANVRQARGLLEVEPVTTFRTDFSAVGDTSGPGCGGTAGARARIFTARTVRLHGESSVAARADFGVISGATGASAGNAT